MGSKKVRLEFQTGYPNGRILGLYNSEDEAAEARDVLIQERLDTYGPDKILNQAPSDKGGRFVWFIDGSSSRPGVYWNSLNPRGFLDGHLWV